MTNRVLAALFVLAVSVMPAAAQDVPAYDVSGGYSLMRGEGETANGWLASVTGNLSPELGITGEGGGNYVDGLSIYTFQAGPRYAFRQNEKATPWVHVLAGIARFGADGFDSATEFVLTPGAGVDIWANPNVGVRLGADYQRVFFEGGGSNFFRFHAGIVLGGPAR